MKIGNEVDHMGTCELERNYSNGAFRRRLINSIVVVSQASLVCAAFFVIILLMVALQ